MKIRHTIPFFDVLIFLIFVSCNKNCTTNTSTNTNREQPAQPEGFTIDTTWGEGTNVPF